ncbi:DMT family transporter [Brucella sp. C7-11G]
MLSSSQTMRAIIMVCLAALCFTLNDTVTKFLIVDYDVTVIIFVRSILAMPLLAVMAIVIGRERVSWSTRVPFHAFRGVIGLLAAYLYIRGLAFLSVAEAAVIVFASPCMITAGSVLFFREKVGSKKWAAVSISFIGVIIAMQPGAGAFQPASLFILGAAFLYAVTSLTARWIPPQDNLWTVSFFGAAFSALLVAPLAFSRWTGPDPADLLLFGVAALCSSLGIGLGALAYRSAAAADLAPFSYTGLIWSLSATWIVWGGVPGPWTFVGALVIAASSVFHFLSSRNDPNGP